MQFRPAFFQPFFTPFFPLKIRSANTVANAHRAKVVKKEFEKCFPAQRPIWTDFPARIFELIRQISAAGLRIQGLRTRVHLHLDRHAPLPLAAPADPFFDASPIVILGLSCRPVVCSSTLFHPARARVSASGRVRRASGQVLPPRCPSARAYCRFSFLLLSNCFGAAFIFCLPPVPAWALSGFTGAGVCGVHQARSCRHGMPLRARAWQLFMLGCCEIVFDGFVFLLCCLPPPIPTGPRVALAGSVNPAGARCWPASCSQRQRFHIF